MDDQVSQNIHKTWFEDGLDQIRSEFKMELNRKLEEQEVRFSQSLQEKQREIDILTDELHVALEIKQRNIDRLTEQLHALSENNQRDINMLTEQLRVLSFRLNDKPADQSAGDFNTQMSDNKERKEGQVVIGDNELDDSTQHSGISPMSLELYSGDFVGFMATPLKKYNYTDSERITFDNVILDSSNSYSAVDSTFTCPYSGYYQFTVTISNVQDVTDGSRKRIDGLLYVGDTTHIRAIASLSKEGIIQSTVQLVSYCPKNEKVYVKANVPSEDDDEERGVNGPDHSAFSGYLVSLDN